MQSPDILHEDATLRVSKIDFEGESSNTVLVSFTGVGHAMGGIDVQRPEFVGTGRAFGRVILVSDLLRSWGNGFDPERLFDVLKPQIEGRQVDVIGNSMGGFLAILFADALDARTCVALCPQFSIHPEVIPQDNRWTRFLDQIPVWTIRDLDGRFGTSTRYYILTGNDPMDALHMARMPDQENVVKVAFPAGEHNVALHLKERGHLNEVLMACFGHDLTPDGAVEMIASKEATG